MATGVAINPNFIFQTLLGLKVLKLHITVMVIMTPRRHSPRGLSRVLTQHGSGFILHGASLLNLAAACAADAAAGIPL